MTTAAQRRNAYLAWAIICLVWGTTYLAIKVGLETIPPFLMGGIRYMIAGSILTLAVLVQGRALPGWRALVALFISGLLLLGVGNGGVIWAELHVSSGLAAVLVATVPFWMVGIEALLPGGERLSRRQLMGLCVGFLGIILLVWPDLHLDGSGSWQFAAGVLALQIACLGWSAGSVYQRRQPHKVEPVTGSAFQMLFGGLTMMTLGSATGEWQALSFTPRTAGALVYLIVAGSLIGFVAYVYALTHLKTSFVSLYAYVNPVVAVALGTLILDEPFGWRLVVSVAIILIGMAIVSAKRPAARPAGTTSGAPSKERSEPEPGDGKKPAAESAA